MFDRAVLRDCTVVAARPPTNDRWHGVTLERCTFLGRDKGCNFGPRPHAYPDEPPGRVDGCDVSGAVMHLCRLFRCDLGATRLPRWPRVSRVDPPRHTAEWLALPFPPALRVTRQVVDEPQDGEAISVMDAEVFAREAGLTPDDVRALVDGRPLIAC